MGCGGEAWKENIGVGKQAGIAGHHNNSFAFYRLLPLIFFNLCRIKNDISQPSLQNLLKVLYYWRIPNDRSYLHPDFLRSFFDSREVISSEPVKEKGSRKRVMERKHWAVSIGFVSQYYEHPNSMCD